MPFPKAKYYLIICAALTAILAVYIFWPASPELKENMRKANIKGTEIFVETASSSDARYGGLSYRKELCGNCGMLFEFQDVSERIFVMRNMNFPLDIIFIKGEDVVKVEKNALPEGAEPLRYYQSGVPADRVLEINAGLSDKIKIAPGDKIKIED